MSEQPFAETLSASRASDRDDMDVAHRLDLREEAEQVRNHHGLVPDHKRRVAEFMDQHRMVQMANLPAVPEIRKLIEDLIVVPRRADRDAPIHRGILAPAEIKFRAASRLCVADLNIARTTSAFEHR